jgi:hypothetical protein
MSDPQGEFVTSFTYDDGGLLRRLVNIDPPKGCVPNMTYDPGPHPPKKIEPEADEPSVIVDPSTQKTRQ